MKKIGGYIVAIVFVLILLGMGVQSCTSKEMCDVATGQECQYESKCKPLLLNLLF